LATRTKTEEDERLYNKLTEAQKQRLRNGVIEISGRAMNWTALGIVPAMVRLYPKSTFAELKQMIMYLSSKNHLMMNRLFQWCLITASLLLLGCGGGNQSTKAPSADDIINTLKARGEQISSEADWVDYNNALEDFLASADSIVQKPLYRRPVTELKKLADSFEKPDWLPLLRKKTVYVEDGKMEFSYTIHRGDGGRWNVLVDGVADRIKVIEERTGKTVKSEYNTAFFDFETSVDYTDVYTLVIECSKPLYADVSVDRKPNGVKSYFQSTDFVLDTLPSTSGDKKAVKYEELVLANVFNEPYKVVISQQMTLSGVTRITIPIELPSGTQEFIYQVRISGEESETREDGKLYDKLSTKYNEYKVLGLKVFESTSTGSSLTRELLNSIGYPKREKFSCNIYFFDKESEAKNFVDGSPSGFKYDIKNSIKNSESRNGVIKYKGKGFVYLGLESTSTFNTTYSWVDVVATKMEMLYVRIKKKPIESTSY